MRYSKLFPKTRKEAPSDAVSINHKLLVQAGFVDQLMAGSWTLLPLGLRVIAKINKIIREEMNAIDGQELLVPLLHPKEIWNETGRWESATEVMYKLTDQRNREHVLSFTAEEIVMDVLRKNINSYQQLPVYVYQFSTKFRNEVRAKSGILRGREFMMKDLYSAHTTEKDLMEYYERAKVAYMKVYERLGFEAKIIEAGGGVFTDSNTHEFQVITEAGEDTIYYCDDCSWGENEEIFEGSSGDKCPNCSKGVIKSAKSVEVGNIFPLGTMYSEKMGFLYTDASGNKKPIWFGSYGIGITRILGTWVEVSHDERGIIWNKQLSPYDVHFVSLEGAIDAEEIYEKLLDSGVDVLWDDRDESAGQKFSDADLIGTPVRLVVSKKTGDKIEWKERKSEEIELLEFEGVVEKLRGGKYGGN